MDMSEGNYTGFMNMVWDIFASSGGGNGNLQSFIYFNYN